LQTLLVSVGPHVPVPARSCHGGVSRGRLLLRQSALKPGTAGRREGKGQPLIAPVVSLCGGQTPHAGSACDTWYCIAEAFEAASRHGPSALSASARAEQRESISGWIGGAVRVLCRIRRPWALNFDLGYGRAAARIVWSSFSRDDSSAEATAGGRGRNGTLRRRSGRTKLCLKGIHDPYQVRTLRRELRRR
jgi:hypothetical protein